MLGFRWREKQERALKEKAEKRSKDRKEGRARRKEGMAFELVLSIFAFLAVAALLGILVYQVNNNPIPFPSLRFPFFSVFAFSVEVFLCTNVRALSSC
jgi:hypothetical protein